MTPQIRTAAAKLARHSGSSAAISLKAIKREAGPHWEKMREAIHLRLESLLRQALGPSDFFLGIDEETYLVAMPSLELDEALICCLRVAYLLHTSLLGPCALDSIHIAQATALDDDLIELKPVEQPHLRTLAESADLDSLTVEGLSPVLLRRSPASSLAGAPAEPPQGRAHHFVPVWDATREIVRAYRCVPVFSAPRAEQAWAGIREQSDRALAILCRAVETLAEHLEGRRRFLVNIPVPYDNLASPVGRMEYIAACRSLSAALRPFLIFEVTDVPDGVPHTRLASVFSCIRPFGQAVIARIPFGARSIAAYENCGVRAIGLRLPALAGEELFQEIARLAACSRLLGLSSFLEGVTGVATVEAALKCNIQWLSGPAIAPPVEEPQQMLRLRIESLACVSGCASPGLPSVPALQPRTQGQPPPGRETAAAAPGFLFGAAPSAPHNGAQGR